VEKILTTPTKPLNIAYATMSKATPSGKRKHTLCDIPELHDMNVLIEDNDEE
jgi:hypothetical protein